MNMRKRFLELNLELNDPKYLNKTEKERLQKPLWKVVTRYQSRGSRDLIGAVILETIKAIKSI